MDPQEYVKFRAESSGKEGPVRAIFFCEFHPKAGPIISCQVPENYISKELFDSISVYIITKPELQRNTITVTLEDYKILGFPVRIDDKRYERNAFQFNLCFVCDSDARTVQYEPVVMKLSDYLTAMEIESRFLSKENVCARLTPMLEQVVKELNEGGECAVRSGGEAARLRVARLRADPPPVADHQVPVLIRPLPVSHTDLTTQRVAPFIDGFNHVARIAVLSDVETNLVKACVQNLVYYGVVVLVPLFQYGNVYCATPKLKLLAQDPQLQARCLQAAARGGGARGPAAARDVFRLLASTARGATVRDLCQRLAPATTARIDERRLIQFAVREGLIRRINKYPVLLGEQQSSDLQKCLNGTASMDEICCAAGLGAHHLEDQIERDHSVVVLWKCFALLEKLSSGGAYDFETEIIKTTN